MLGIAQLLDMDNRLLGKDAEKELQLPVETIQGLTKLAIVGLFCLELDVVKTIVSPVAFNSDGSILDVMDRNEHRQAILDEIVRQSHVEENIPKLPE